MEILSIRKIPGSTVSLQLVEFDDGFCVAVFMGAEFVVSDFFRWKEEAEKYFRESFPAATQIPTEAEIVDMSYAAKMHKFDTGRKIGPR